MENPAISLTIAVSRTEFLSLKGENISVKYSVKLANPILMEIAYEWSSIVVKTGAG